MTGSAEIIRNAYAQGLAILAFNIPYLPMMESVVRAVRDTDSFAFITTARLEWTKFEAGGPVPIAEEFARCDDPRHVRLHLDHVPVIDEDDLRVDYAPIFREALGAGFQSVMIDASRLPLDGNIAATAEVVAMAHGAGVACEAELGAVFGHEAGPPPPYDELFESGMGFTAVDEAARFVDESGCDWLSVAIGSVHGAISGAARDQKKVQARLNLAHLAKLRDATGIPLVLHGGSGIRQEAVLAAAKCGIAKVNVATEIRQAYEAALRDTGDVAASQEAVYQRTVWLIEEYYRVGGIRGSVNRE